MNKTPQTKVKEDFGSKDKLVDEILALLKKPSDLSKDQFKKKLQKQSNKKLMVLLSREKTLKEQYGSREKLIDAITQNVKGTKKSTDNEYKKQLATRTTGQLLDLARRALKQKG